ncbi:phosphoglycolate phosphatase [Aliivibrio kagoshimensis]|uniref:phosphoglycolate phosphatase n=1 Tax=Aliivibrio kagoshimensis TaxID=2910230 RepID=UPI003D0E45C5
MSRFSDIKLIAFDLDGTLLDSVPDLAIAADLTMQDFGYPRVSLEQASHWIGNGADVLIARALSGSMSIDPTLSPELVKEARKRFDQHYKQGEHKLSHLYPHVLSTLETLKKAGFTLALVTNKPAKFVPELLVQHQLDHLFSDVIGGDTFTEKKPNPMSLNWLLEKHGVTANQVVMVGDSKNDIKAAHNAGCYSIGLTYGYNHGEPIANSNPDCIYDDFEQIVSSFSLS